MPTIPFLKVRAASAVVKSCGDSHHAKMPPKPAALLHQFHVNHALFFRCKKKSREGHPQTWATFILVIYLHKSGENQSGSASGNLCLVDR